MKTSTENLRTYSHLLVAAVVGLLLLASPPAASAYFQPGPPGDTNFEIDANASDEGVAGDDWATFYPTPPAPHDNLVATTGIIDDGPQKSIFTGGGSKDIRDIPDWQWRDGAVPDKDDILHAYFAAYGVDTELILYIGADRFSNDGDAMMGAWFFQDEVNKLPDGTFSGQHRNGDILWLGHFTGGGIIASLQIYVWNDPALSNYDSTLVVAKGTNLALVAEGQGGIGTGYYATANQTDTAAPWTYTPKQGTPGFFPYNAFMEGGINVSEMLGGDLPCFSSVLIETRSSTSLTAQLKDFVLGSLNTCKISVAKSCLSSQLAADLESIDYTYGVTVTNVGYGTVTSVDIRDDVGTADPDTADDLAWTYTGDITTGNTVPVTPGGVPYLINSQYNPPHNWVYAHGHVGAYATAGVTDDATCPQVPLNPEFTVTQACSDVKVVGLDGKVVVRVDFAGQVCNNDAANPGEPNTKIKNVQVTHEAAGVVLSGVTLLPGECRSFTGSFYPAPLDIDGDGTPAAQEYGKWVQATGTEPLTNTPMNTGQVDPDPATTCDLCGAQ